MFICSYTDFQVGLDEVPRSLKGKQLHRWILNNLRHRDRMSSFELSELPKKSIRVLYFLERLGKFKMDNKKYGFPYIALTNKRI